MNKYRRVLIRFFVLVAVGSLCGLYLNQLMRRAYVSQVPDYLSMPPHPNWFLAVPIFALMIGLVVIGFLGQRKFGKNEGY